MTCFEICRRFWIRGNHLITEFVNQARIAQLLDSLFPHDSGRASAACEHLGENVFALFAANFSTVDQVDQLIERLGRNRSVVDGLASRAERVLEIVPAPTGN